MTRVWNYSTLGQRDSAAASIRPLPDAAAGQRNLSTCRATTRLSTSTSDYWFVGLIRRVQHTYSNAIRQKPDFACRLRVVLVGSQGVKFGRIHFLDSCTPIGLDRIDRPDAFAGLSGSF